MSLYFVCCSVGVSVSLVSCVFMNCLVTQFTIYFGVVAILLLNVIAVFSVGGGLPKNVRVVPVVPVCI